MPKSGSRKRLELTSSDELAPKNASERPKSVPLAEQLRPKKIDEFAGAEDIDQTLIDEIRSGGGRAPSLILWGPPGSGKTTLAKLIGGAFDVEFVELSAVLSGVKEVREVVERARYSSRPTMLFVDEIHRFNKGQQDAFLPHVEAGTISLVGATTENPSFYLTGALLSRCRVVVVPPLSEDAMQTVLDRASKVLEITFSPDAASLMIQMGGSDARKLITLIETFTAARRRAKVLDATKIEKLELEEFLKDAHTLLYDRSGEEHYNIASAFIKSMRGSDPDAALYWGFRMLEAGEDPRFVIRRMIIFASEDVGNADPRALQIAMTTFQAFEVIGLPEGRIPIAHCITYLATAPKSNRSYSAMHSVLRSIKDAPRAPVPLHLRNAPTSLMEGLGYGAEYQYPHDTPHGYTPGVSYLPEETKGSVFYRPSERGYEKTIKERMEWLRSLTPGIKK